MTDFSARLVLRPGVGREAISRVAWERDWDIHDIGDANSDVYIDVWFTQDERAEIHYVEDSLVGLSYVTLRGEDADIVEQQIRRDCELWELPQALSDLRQAVDRNDRLRSVYAVALTAPAEQDEQIVDLYREVASDSDSGIRQSVIVATGYLPWPALQELVRELQSHDPADHVRKNAEIMLEGIRLYGPG